MKKVDRIICSCDTCGKELKLLPRDYNLSKLHFCSKKCYWVERKNPKYTLASRAIVSANHKLGLNNPSGENAYNWKGGKNKCIDCGIELSDRYSERCYSCSMKYKHKLKGNNPEVILTCSICGVMYTAKSCNIDKSSINHYCSKECTSIGVSLRTRGKILKIDRVPAQIFNEVRNCPEYNDWRKFCFNRDNYKCTNCGLGGKLHVHHKTTVKNLIKKYNIVTKEEALEIDEFWDTNNGVTLCPECHKEEHRRLKQIEIINKRKESYVVS